MIGLSFGRNFFLIDALHIDHLMEQYVAQNHHFSNSTSHN